MRITYLAAGAAGMYCGSCLHDNTLAAALADLGEQVRLVPTYTPIRTDERDVSEPLVLMGGINVYLQQRWPLLRRTPRLFDAMFDHPNLIGWLASRGVSRKADELGGLAVSMLRGDEGNLRKEVHKLGDWLAARARPDVVHLSNSMLVGLARTIRRRTGAPVICSLSGEDIFLEKLPPPYYEQARALLRERAADVDHFVAMNGYYADFMADYLDVDRQRVSIVPHGLDLADHGTRRAAGDATVTIGYFARICQEKGLHQLVEAFARLAARSGMPPLRLVAGGYLGAEDRDYFARVEARIAGLHLADCVTIVREPDRARKIALLQSFDLMCLPTEYRESKGLPVLEALANAVPVVLPRHGSFPELAAETGGALLYEPGDADGLVEALARLAVDRALADELGRRGQAAVREKFTAERMARQTLDIYREQAACQRSIAPRAASSFATPTQPESCTSRPS